MIEPSYTSSRILDPFSDTEDITAIHKSYDELSKLELTAVWYPRIVGFITVITSSLMITMAWTRRKHLFHRLVLGKKVASQPRLL